MIRNYLIMAIRTLRKQKTCSVIKIAGFAVGIASCILLFFYVRHDLAFDRFHQNIDRIYYFRGSVDLKFAVILTPAGGRVASQLEKEFSQVESAARAMRQNLILKAQEQSMHLAGLATDPSLFDVFSFPLKFGRKESALSDVSSIVLSAAISQAIFGEADPTGETVSMKIGEEFKDFIVGGVTSRVPSNSSITFDFLIRVGAVLGDDAVAGKAAVPTFIVLKEGCTPGQLERRFPETIDQELARRYQQYESFDPQCAYRLLPLKGFHLNGLYDTQLLTNRGHRTYHFILAAIAFSILFIACINYTNLSVSDISGRAGEIGMRKALGADQREIAHQFLLEALVISLISMGMALLLTALLHQGAHALLGNKLPIRFFDSMGPVLFLLLLTLLVSGVSALYPALIMTRLSPVALFQGQLGAGGKNRLSKTLIVIQFTIASFLIIGMLFLNGQRSYLLSKDLGYENEGVVRVDFSGVTDDLEINHAVYRVFKNGLKQHAGIDGVSGTTQSFSNGWSLMSGFKPIDGGADFIFNDNGVDVDYLRILGVPIRSGKDFSEESPMALKNGIIVNEAFLRQVGSTDVVGKTFGDFFESSSWNPKTILGVMADYHYLPLNFEIKPVVLSINRDELFRFVYIKFHGDAPSACEIIEREFQKAAPNIPFQLLFLHDEVKSQYKTEKQWGQVVAWASASTIVIACSGLFALTLLVVTRRTKEIGIRKVLGASLMDIIRIIFREFFGLIVLANLITWPAAWYCVNLYLNNYSYKIALNLWFFAAAGAITLAIAWTSVSIHAVRAALMNPVNSLRYE